jgi:hypothetical protein
MKKKNIFKKMVISVYGYKTNKQGLLEYLKYDSQKVICAANAKKLFIYNAEEVTFKQDKIHEWSLTDVSISLDGIVIGEEKLDRVLKITEVVIPVFAPGTLIVED